MPNITPAKIDSLVGLFERETGCGIIDREGFAHDLALALWSGLPRRGGVRANQAHLATLARHLEAFVATYDNIPLYPIAAGALSKALAPLFRSAGDRDPLAVVRDDLAAILAAVDKAISATGEIQPESVKPANPSPAILVLRLGALYRRVTGERPKASGAFLTIASAAFKLIEPQWKPEPDALRMRVQRALAHADEFARAVVDDYARAVVAAETAPEPNKSGDSEGG